MKLKNRLLVIFKNMYCWLIAFFLIIATPINVIDFLLFGKVRSWKYLENKMMQTLFEITDLQKRI